MPLLLFLVLMAFFETGCRNDVKPPENSDPEP
jgi:hypothetical protein